MSVIVSLVILAVVVIALVDIITRPEGDTKHLPKIVCVLLVVSVQLIGSLLWFTNGREYNTHRDEAVSFGYQRRWSGSHPAVAVSDASARSTEQQLADLDAEIDYCKQCHTPGQEKP